MTQNVARSLAEHDERPQRTLRSVPAQEPTIASGGSEVVAEILSDGSVRPVVTPDGETKPRAWSEGSISGRSWILWWSRRSFSQA